MSAAGGTNPRGLLSIQLGEDGQSLGCLFRLAGAPVRSSQSGVDRPIARIELLRGFKLGNCFVGALLRQIYSAQCYVRARVSWMFRNSFFESCLRFVELTWRGWYGSGAQQRFSEALCECLARPLSSRKRFQRRYRLRGIA